MTSIDGVLNKFMHIHNSFSSLIENNDEKESELADNVKLDFIYYRGEDLLSEEEINAKFKKKFTGIQQVREILLHPEIVKMLSRKPLICQLKGSKAKVYFSLPSKMKCKELEIQVENKKISEIHIYCVKTLNTRGLEFMDRRG